MKKNIFSIVVTIILLCAFIYADTAKAEANISKRPGISFYEQKGEIYVKDTTIEELENLFKAVSYNDYIYMPNMLYPAIFLQKLPSNYAELKDESYRNRLFIQILVPIAIKVKEDIEKERNALFYIHEQFKKNTELTEAESVVLEDWAKVYDVYTPLKGSRRIEYLFEELKKKLDIIPVSMLIGVAAIESNWGTSRPALQANGLYKEKVWFGEEKGLAPEGEDADDDYEFKIFDSIYDAMMSYSIKINSGIDYFYMREYRSEYRRRKGVISGRTLAHSMMQSSELKNFAGLLDYTITFYDMDNLDYAKLLRTEY